MCQYSTLVLSSSISFPTTAATGKHPSGRGSFRGQPGLSCLTLGLEGDLVAVGSVEASFVEGSPAAVAGSTATVEDPGTLAAAGSVEAGSVELHSPSGATLAIPSQALNSYGSWSKLKKYAKS